MCPVCLVTSGLYVAGGFSAGALTTFLATRLRKRPEATVPTSTQTEGDDHAATGDRIER